MKNDVLFDGEKPLRTNEARLIDLAALTIAAIQRNGERIPVRAAGDLAKNQVSAGKIGDHQSGAPLFAATISARKRNDDDFACYRFDHAASSSGEFQSRPRTDSLSAAPLNAVSSSESLESSSLTLWESEISSPTLRIFSSKGCCANSRRNSDFICWAASSYTGAGCRPATACRSLPDPAFAQCARNLYAGQRSQRWR